MLPSFAPTRLQSDVLRLALPAIVAGLVSTVVFFTDRLLIARYDDRALASMQIAGPLLWSLFSVGGATLSGTLAVVGQAMGGNRVDHARQSAAVVLLAAVVLGTALATVSWLMLPTIAQMLAGADEHAASTRALARTYIETVLPFAPVVLLAEVGIVVLHASGDTRTPLRIGIVTGLTNLAVSGALIHGMGPFPSLGVQGAAIGTAAAFVLMAASTLLALVVGPFGLRWSDVRAARASPQRLLGPVLRVGAPTLGERLVFHAGFMVFAGIVARLGDTAMTANQSLVAIESIGFLSAAGFGVASGSLVARTLGAGLPDEARTVGRTAAVLGASCLGVVSLVFLAIPEVLVRVFSDDPAVVALGARCLRVAAVAQPIMAMSDSFAGALRGAGDTRSPMVVALVGPVVVRLGACSLFTMVLDFGLLGIWLGTTLDWATRALVLGVIWHRGGWVARNSVAESRSR